MVYKKAIIGNWILKHFVATGRDIIEKESTNSQCEGPHSLHKSPYNQ
jgi:hypothetical protein